MPISEDEFDHQNGNNVPQQSGMSKAELRRSNKPIMEKRRRARINHCLNELKTLILDAMKKDPARHSKLEKADILEMTVKHLQTIQRQQLAAAVGTDTNVLQKFKSGFNECAGEVTRFVGNIDGVESGVKQRLVAHLSNCVNGLQQITPFTFPGLSGGAGMVGASFGASPSTINVPIQDANINATGVPLVVPQVSFPPGDVNNNNGANTRIQMQGGIQLIPSRLPTGELALLVPNSSNMHFFPPAALGSSSTHQQQQPIVDSSSQHSRNENKPHPSSTLPKSSHFSAFTTVTKMNSPNVYKYNKASSPPLSPASSTTSLGEENYRKMHSPSPTAHFQTSTISASFPTPPNQSHTPLNYKIAQVPVQTQAEHQRVTSTVTDPNSISTSVNNEIKIGYQTVPIYQHNEKPRHWSVANVKIEKQLTPEGTDHEQPLSVVTSERYKIPVQYPQDTFTVHPQSSKKRTYQDISSERLLVVANFATSSPKMPKYSSDVVSSSQHTEHRSSPENIVNKSDSDLSFKSSPSTSANSSGQSTSGSSDSMWRPW